MSAALRRFLSVVTVVTAALTWTAGTSATSIGAPTTRRAATPTRVTVKKGATTTRPVRTTVAPSSLAPRGSTTTLPPGVPAKELLIAGASDLRPAFEEIGARFTAQTGTKVTFSFGSSGQLAQQLLNGAPFDVFASADVGYVNDVVKAGIGDASTKQTYAFGRLAMWVPGRTQKRVFNLIDLTEPTIKRIAVANPEHAPYGVAAVQALRSSKIYDIVEDKLVYGENVSDAYRLGTSGNADAALVSLSLVIANKNGGRYVVVSEDAHRPLEQAMVVTAKRERAYSARAFVSFVSSPTGHDIMRAYGFLLPDDPKPTNDNG